MFINSYYIKFCFIIFIYISNAFNIGMLPKNINTKKLITLSPGGLSGFYSLGATSYIKQNYNLTDYVFLGASAGSWNALMLTYKHDNNTVIEDLFNQDLFYNSKNLPNLQQNIKNYILNTYSSDDFYLHKLYLSVSVFNFFYFKSRVLYNFSSINDAVQGCFYSSYIPFVTGSVKLINIKNLIFDGGWPKFPPKNIDYHFTISPSMWGKNFTRAERFKYPTDYNFFKNLYELGYNDTRDNKHILDTIFLV